MLLKEDYGWKCRKYAYLTQYGCHGLLKMTHLWNHCRNGEDVRVRDGRCVPNSAGSREV